MAFFRKNLREHFTTILTTCAKLKLEHFSTKKRIRYFMPHKMDLVHWLGIQLMMDHCNILGNASDDPENPKQFRKHYKTAQKWVFEKWHICFPLAENRVSNLRDIFIPTVEDITYFQDLCSAISSSNILIDTVTNIAVDEVILDATARIENRKRSDTTKEKVVDTSGMTQ